MKSEPRPRKSGLQIPLRSVRNALLGMVILLQSAVTYSQPQAHSGARFAGLSQQADQAREANDLERAIKLYREALALRPRWAEGWWSLGTIYYDRSAYADAARAFRRLIAVAPDHGTGHAMLGLCQFELGQDAVALQNLQAGRSLGLHKDPQLRAVVYYHEGLLFLRQHKFSSAQEVLTVLAREGAEDPNAAIALGMSVLLIPPKNEPPEGSMGRDIVLRVGRAEALGANKNFDEAKQIYASVLETAADFPNLHYGYGRFLLDIEETDEAVTQFEQDIQSNPGHVQAYLEIAAVRYRVDSAAGVKYAEKAVALDPHLPFGHYLLGLLYLDTGEYAKSVRELEVARQSFSEKPEIYFALGNAYAKAGRKEEAAGARATFRQLKAKTGPQGGPTTYGERQPLSLEQQNPGSAEGANPQN